MAAISSLEDKAVTQPRNWNSKLDKLRLALGINVGRKLHCKNLSDTNNASIKKCLLIRAVNKVPPSHLCQQCSEKITTTPNFMISI